MYLSRYLAALFFLFTSVGLRCEVLLNDPFNDGNRSNTSGGDALGAVWYQSTPETGTVTVVYDSPGLGSGNALRLATKVDFHKLLAFFPARSLAATGDAIRVTFDYRFESPASFSGGNFRVGLGYSNGTRQSSDTDSTASTETRYDDVTYGFSTNPLDSTEALKLNNETTGTDILTGQDRVSFSSSARPAWDAAAQKHSALLQIVRQANGDLLLKARIDNQETAAATHAAREVLTYQFDEFAFGIDGDRFRPVILVDNVSVEFVNLPQLNITATDASASEVGPDVAEFTVTRNPTAGTLSVPITLGGTAVSGSDYEASGDYYVATGSASGVVNFPDGEDSATITITPKSDYFVEGNETVEVTLEKSDTWLLQADPAKATAKLADDPTATIVNDRDFFAALDLTRPELSTVETKVAAATSGDFTAAKSALATYFRTRSSTPAFPLEAITSTTVLSDAKIKKYTVLGKSYQFPSTVTSIDWAFNPTDPANTSGSTLNTQWTYQFNRHAWWDDLAKASVNDSGTVTDSAALNEFKFELNDWITKNPVPLKAKLHEDKSRWRPLDAGIRMQLTWPYAFQRLRKLPKEQLSDDLLVLWVKSFYMHAQHLQAYPDLTGNVCTNECQGLYTLATIFPEFKDAATWRTAALTRASNVLTNDVFADGAEGELSPTYHDVIVSNIEAIKLVAAAYGQPTTSTIVSKLEAMYNYQMLLTEPGRSAPRINDSTNDMDSGEMGVENRMKGAFSSYPGRTDFQWLAKDGLEGGTMPSVTSHLFPDAGQVVMRSGWSRADSYLLMDAGPFGSTHQHEDKLSISVDGYGVRHIIDCGPYNYDTSIYRAASLLSHANSQPIIDDLDQNREASPESLWTKQQAIAWHTSDVFDYASASYGADDSEGWQKVDINGNKVGALVRPAVTTRHIFFMKPDVWVVVDAFKALDAAPHKYTALFNCSDQSVETDAATQRVTVQLKAGEFDPQALATVTSTKPSLTITPLIITPLISGNQTRQIVTGNVTATQTAPIMGWQYYINKGYTEKNPIPTACFNRTTAGDTQMAYVLAAAQATASPRTPTVEAVTAGEIGTGGPATFGVHVTEGASKTTYLVGLDGSNTTWQGLVYAVPALIVKDGVVFRADDDSVQPSLTVQSGGFTPSSLSLGAYGKVAMPDYRAQVTATDNVGVVRLTQSPAPGTVLTTTEPTTVVVQACDAAGNVAETSFLLTVTADLVSDPFTDGNRTAGADSLGLVWYQSLEASNAVTFENDFDPNDSSPGDKAMKLTPSTDFHKLLAFFPKTTLAVENDSISLTFNYRFPDGAGDKGDGLRVGLGYSADTRQTSDGPVDRTGAQRTDDVNYGFNTNPGLASTGGTGLKYEGAGDDILGGSAPGDRKSVGTTNGASVVSGTTSHRANFKITRQANGDLKMFAQIDSATAATGTLAASTAAALGYSFDEIAFGLGGTGYRPTIIVDDVCVSAVLAPTTTNAVPTLTSISNPAAISEDAPAQTVNLSGISSGSASENQALTVSATSSNTALIPNPTVTYTSPATTGSLRYTPVANASGTANITVSVNDGQSGNQTVTRSFAVVVNPVNDVPTLTAISDPAATDQNAGERTVNLSGIGSGAANEIQALTVSATSNNTALIPHPRVTYTSPEATGSLRYTPAANASGTAQITVTVNDGQLSNSTKTQTFTVKVRTPYESWLNTNFTGSAATSAAMSDTADPNGNGLCNLLEYALGGDPLGENRLVTPEEKVAPELKTITDLSSNRTCATLTFKRNTTRTDITIKVLGADSPDGPWTDKSVLAQSTGGGAFVLSQNAINLQTTQTGVVLVAPVETGTGSTRTVTVTDIYAVSVPATVIDAVSNAVSVPAHPRRFLRLRVER